MSLADLRSLLAAGILRVQPGYVLVLTTTYSTPNTP